MRLGRRRGSRSLGEMGKRYLDRLRSRPLDIGEGSSEVSVYGEREGVGV